MGGGVARGDGPRRRAAAVGQRLLAGRRRRRRRERRLGVRRRDARRRGRGRRRGGAPSSRRRGVASRRVDLEGDYLAEGRDLCFVFCLVSCVLVFCTRVCPTPSTRSFSLSLSNAIDATEDCIRPPLRHRRGGFSSIRLDRRSRLRDGQTPKAPSDAENARAAKEAATAARRRGAPPWTQTRPRWAAARATRTATAASWATRPAATAAAAARRGPRRRGRCGRR